ncbi:response regulator [Aphanothece sacrum]|nr:response regulator [Aphanothece sacrum]
MTFQYLFNRGKKNGNALVVEDSLTEREIITQCLKLAGITVVIASSGKKP